MRLVALAATVALLALLLPLGRPEPAAAAVPSGFREYIALSGLNKPTAVEFASNDDVVVAEKSGTIKVFDDFDDSTPAVYNQLRTKVHNYWDRGLVGLVLSPSYASNHTLYVLYTYDAAIGGSAPRWGEPDDADDNCPSPPGGTDDGCVVSGRLSKVVLSGTNLTETSLIENWCQQFPSHTVGDLAFGADGALYVSGGDGASFNYVDYGQDGDPRNPCGDPPGGVGATLAPPTAEGGALRSQDLRTSGDPVGLSGAILRVDPGTGAALSSNPLYSNSDTNARRIVAYGLRNPFRIAVRPGTNEIWAGDVGWNTWEEIDKTVGSDSTVDNFGWPCYEGAGKLAGYDGADLNICENLYASPSAVTAPVLSYQHGQANGSSDSCQTPGGSSTTGLAFYPSSGGSYPAEYQGALFFADYTRDCIWVMRKGGNGLPDPATRTSFATSAANPVDLEIGPGSDLYYVDINGGSVRRIGYSAGNQPPQAAISASPGSGEPPLEVDFDGSGSGDPDPGDTLTYAWDLDGDGQYDDSTSAQPTRTYTVAGNVTVGLRVTDALGATDVAQVSIAVGRTAPLPQISSPSGTIHRPVGATISYSGSATDPQDGPLPASALTWSADLHHCTGPDDDTCHLHGGIYAKTGVTSGTFVLPDHEPNAWVELKLTATWGGESATVTRRIDYDQVELGFSSSPTGIGLTVGASTGTTSFTRTANVGGKVSISAPVGVVIGSKTYQFDRWSDGGAMAHDITVPSSARTYTATYREGPPPPGTVLFSDWFDDGSAHGWTVAEGTWAVCRPNLPAPYNTPAYNTPGYCARTLAGSTSLAGSSTWKDYSVQTAVAFPTDAGGAMVLGRAQDATHAYQFQLKKTGSGEHRWYLQRREGSTSVTLKSVAYNYAIGRPYHLKLELKGTKLTAYISSTGGRTWTLLGSATDAKWASGKAGVRAWSTLATFDAVKVVQM